MLAQGSTLQSVVRHAEELRAAIGPLGGHNLAVFGSVARGEDRADSDVDLLIDLDEGTGLFALLRMQRLAEDILQRTVDLVPRSGLKPDVAARAFSEAVPLCDHRDRGFDSAVPDNRHR
ncbi:nucleotidyltransferase family protein [Gulosibacter chungangensis]|uniref:Nucleotidyltransferase family protein n=2 Tax=Gulosibacter chungangensis TaxID=979746 RepID=A0A7J5B7Y4_9MICO|nr:nucleotidyltransferase family protein [Gulosibacter chungangensis]